MPRAACTEGESQWQPGLRLPQGWAVGPWHHGTAQQTAPGAAQAFRVVSVGSAPGEELPVPWQHRSTSCEVTTGGQLAHRIAIRRCFNAIVLEL